MRLTLPSFMVVPLLLLSSAGAMALGMGRVSTVSTLGSPLEFSVSLTALPSDGLSTDCINAEVYAGDGRVSPDMVRLRITRGADGTPASLRVSTGTRIDEPVASVEITLNCGTRVSRKYVVFIDPPVVELAQAGAAESTAAPAPRLERERPAARRERLAAAEPRRTRRATTQPGTVQPSGTGVASAARQRRSELARSARAARAAASAAVAAESGSRLKLESAPLLTAVGPAQAKSGAPVAAGKPSAGSASAALAPNAASAAVGGASGALVAGDAASASLRRQPG